MNILYLCHRIPFPPHTGDKVRSYHQIRHLARHHRVALACFVDDRSDLQHVATLRQWCTSVDVAFRSRRTAQLAGLRGLWTGHSLAVMAFQSSALERKIAARAKSEKFEAIVAFSGAMAPYGARVPSKARVVDFVDMDSEKWRLYADRLRWPASWLYRLEADRLARFEIETARAWDRAIFVSRREASLMRTHVGDRTISILGNGVDLDFFSPGPPSPEPAAADIVFTGAMDYFPNADASVYFCDTILPLIRTQVPGARFAIVGRNPTAAVRRLASRPGVLVTGTVPDVRTYMRGAGVSVAPLRIARGVQNKILESMAMGIPVVSTGDAYRGLDSERPEGIDVADDPAAFASAVVRLLRDEPYRVAQGIRARAYVERHHRWDRHGDKLEEILTLLVQSRALEGDSRA